eukprot:Gb_16659 [translate_table: standard]
MQQWHRLPLLPFPWPSRPPPFGISCLYVGFLSVHKPCTVWLKAGGSPLRHSLAASVFQSFWFCSSFRRCLRWGSFSGLLYAIVGMLYFDLLRLVWSFGDQRCLPLHAQVFIPLFNG